MRTSRCWMAALVGRAAGCAVPADVASCGPVRIVEVMSSGESMDEPLPWTGEKMDFIELENVSSGASAESWELGGFEVRLSGSNVEAPLPPLALHPSERALLVASTYFLADTFETIAAEPDVPWTGVLLDMNNDLSAIDLLAPDGAVCQTLALGDQHAGLSMSSRLEDEHVTWCMTPPTPGAENDPCIDG